MNTFGLIVWVTWLLISSARVIASANPETRERRQKRDGARYRSRLAMDYAWVPISGAFILLCLYSIYHPETP